MFSEHSIEKLARIQDAGTSRQRELLEILPRHGKREDLRRERAEHAARRSRLATKLEQARSSRTTLDRMVSAAQEALLQDEAAVQASMQAGGWASRAEIEAAVAKAQAQLQAANAIIAKGHAVAAATHKVVESRERLRRAEVELARGAAERDAEVDAASAELEAVDVRLSDIDARIAELGDIEGDERRVHERYRAEVARIERAGRGQIADGVIG